MKDSPKVYSVGQVNSYIKRLFADDFILRNLSIRGEISNCKYHSSGHVYFSLKDASGVISAVMWRSDAANLAFRLEDGKQVIVHGSVSIYEPSGRYQIYVKSVQEEGLGDLAARFEALKKKLGEMGMFAEEYKKPIPAFSSKIGVVTAQTGAVIRDIYNVASRRNPYCQILLYPAQVQGDGAAQTIANGIAYLDQNSDVDVIIIGRGGGSMEDLWPFNEEVVAQAIFASSKPVISAVGHETDFTIADFVADLRAPTPSAAAELAVFDYDQFLKNLADIKYTMKLQLDRKVERRKHELKQYELQVKSLSPENQLLKKTQYLGELSDRMNDLMETRIRKAKEFTMLSAEKLHGLSPLKRLSEGYAFVTDPDGKALTEIKQVETGDAVRIHVTDGILSATVQTKEEVSYE